MKGQVAVVTGGAGGIGSAIARLFVAEGGRVVIADVQAERGEALAHELGSTARFRPLDVASEEAFRDLLHETERDWGQLDCLINNAGDPGPTGPIEATSLADFDRALAVLFRSVFVGTKYAVPWMKKRRSGTIINIASVSGLIAGSGGHTYSAAKAAVIHLTKSTALELGEWGIRVNCVCPGGVATPMIGQALGLTQPLSDLGRVGEVMAANQPIPKPIRPEDIAEAVRWLASEESAMVTGHALVVDGGSLAGSSWSAMQARRQKMRESLASPS
jgi:NAD(P)-dependent dehydrogenase (short-subunit alcohol dehydrogenase family)